MSLDDSSINYNSLLGDEGLKLRFSEEITDKSHSNNLGKLFRQIQHSRWRETDVEKNLTREQELQLRFLLKERKKNVRRERTAREEKIRRGRSWPESGLDINRRTKQRTVIKEEVPARATSIIITSSALTFILLAATLVTFTFLMSPVIEEMFVVTKISEINTHNANNTLVWPPDS